MDFVLFDIWVDIIVGKDVNLNVLFIFNYIMLFYKKIRENDECFVRNLILDEFIIVFGWYKCIMCNVYFNRMDELDVYLFYIIEIVNIWFECFYEYY